MKKQLRSRWGKDRKRQEGKSDRGRGGSGQGGGAALYGQDSSRKAGGESRDVIPQLYPAVTIWVRGEVERQRREVGRDGRGEKGHGGNKERKEETRLSSVPGIEGRALPAQGPDLQREGQRCGGGGTVLSACTCLHASARATGIPAGASPGLEPSGSLIPCLVQHPGHWVLSAQ